jgi:CYTH domain-containing protein
MAGSPTMKYAVVEREHRYVVLTPPAPSLAVRTLQIDDRYLRGTRLRLRRVREDGLPDVLKLGQKVRFDQHDPSALAHTTLYLDDAEHAALASLPADTLRKTRRHVPLDGAHLLAVDSFHDRLDGLVLAELDLGADRVLPPAMPHGLGPDVTHDERFTGAALAATDGETLHALLTSLGL